MAVKKAGNGTLRKLAIEPKKKWTHDMTPEEELDTPMGRILSVYREKKRAYVDPEEKNQEYRRQVWQKQQEQQKAEEQRKSFQRTQNNFQRMKQDRVGAMMDDINRKRKEREEKEKAQSFQRTQNNFSRSMDDKIGAMLDTINQKKQQAEQQSAQRTQNNFSRSMDDKFGAVRDAINRQKQQAEQKRQPMPYIVRKGEEGPQRQLLPYIVRKGEEGPQRQLLPYIEENGQDVSAQRTQNNFQRGMDDRIDALLGSVNRQRQNKSAAEAQAQEQQKETNRAQFDRNMDKRISAVTGKIQEDQRKQAEAAATDQAAQKEAEQGRFDRFMGNKAKPVEDIIIRRNADQITKYLQAQMDAEAEKQAANVDGWSKELKDYFENTDPMYMQERVERNYARAYYENEIKKLQEARAKYDDPGYAKERRIGAEEYRKTPQGEVRWLYENMSDPDSAVRATRLERINSIIQNNPDIFGEQPIFENRMQLMDAIDTIAPAMGKESNTSAQQQLDKVIRKYQDKIAMLDESEAKWGPIEDAENKVAENDSYSTAFRPDDVLHRRPLTMIEQMHGRSYDEISLDGLTDDLEKTYVIAANQYYYQNEVPKAKWYAECYMNEKQVDTFMAYMNDGKREEAKAYYEAIKPYLNEKMMQYHEQKWRELAHIGSGSEFTVGAASLGYNLVGGITGTIGTIAALLGDKEAQDKNSWYYYLTNSTNAIRDERGDAWGQRFKNIFGEGGYEVGKWASGVTYSMMDNALAMAVSGGITGGAEKLSQGAVQLIMSSESTANAMVQNLNRGLGATESALMAIGSGAIEALTEKYSLEALLNPNVKEFLGDWKKMASYIGKNVLAEGSEEAASDVLNLIMEKASAVLFDHQTEIEQEADEYVRDMMAKNPGYTNYDIEKWQREGMAQAWGGWWEQLGLDALAGGTSGFGMSAIRAGMNAVGYRSTGRNIAEGSAEKHSSFKSLFGSRNNEIDTTQARQSDGERNKDFLLKMGNSMNKDSNAFHMASEIQEDIKKGKKISYSRWGKLAANIQYEGSEQVRESAEFAIEDIVREDLEQQGVKKRDAEGLAQIISKASTQGMDALNKDERTQLKENEPAYQILEAMMRPESGRTTDAAKRTAFAARIGASMQTAKAREDLNTVESIAEGKGIPQRPAVKRRKDSLKAARSAVAQASDETINAMGGRDAIGREASTVIAYTGSGENAEAKAGKVVGFEKGKVKIQFADGTTETMDPASIETTNTNAQGLIGYMKAHAGMMSDEVAGKALAALDDAGETAAPAFAQDAVNINLAARLGQAMPVHSMSESYAKVIYETARAEAEAADAARMKPTARVQPGKGGASWDGVQYGTKEWTQKTKSLEEETRRQANAAAEIARTLGMKIEFIYDDSENGREMNGSYNEETGVVTVNLGAKLTGLDENGNETVKGAVNALATIPHEFTHWLQANSKDGYRQLVRFVMSDMERNGLNIEERLQHTIDNYNDYYKKHNITDGNGIRQMTLDDAVYEMVANSTEKLFTSEEFANRLKQQNEGLFNKAKEYVQNLINRIKTALTGVDSSIHREARYLKNVDEMARIWLGAYDEVIHNAVTKAEVTTMSPEEAQKTLNEALKKPASINLDDRDNSPYNPEFIRSVRMPEGEDVPQIQGSRDIRHSIADQRTRNILGMFSRWQVAQNEDSQKKILRKYGMDNDTIRQIIDGGVMKEGSYADYGISEKDIKALQMLSRDTAKWQDREMESLTLDEEDLDAQYINAWRRGDNDEMERLLLEKMAGEDGIIAYKAPQWYDTERHRQIAKLIKQKDPEAIAIAAWEMSRLVPKNAVLIPMPPHTGVVTDDTDTMVLAKKISELTGRPVINALAGVEREKRYDSKENKSVKKQVTAEDMGFRQTAEIPDGAMPYFIDNVVGSGTTAKAAHDALGKGLTLAYAKSTRAAIPQLKNAATTFIDPRTQQYLIPLSARVDMEKTGVKGLSYSIREMEKTYKSLDVDPIISFTGTMEQIDAKEKTEAARMDEFRKLIERNEFMALEFVHPSGNREILHHSTRPGVEWQLSYIGNDGIPNMHESYGPIKGQDAGKENVHSMDELYRHFVSMNLQDDLKFNVMEDDNVVTPATIEKAATHPKKRFSITEPVEAKKGGLIAVHNLTYENLMDTLKEGGFTAPSIAIVKAAMGHSKYGDISVIFKKSAVDPRNSAKNKIYGADAYTPTRINADVETELKYDEMLAIRDRMAKLFDGKDSTQKSLKAELERWFSEKTYKEVTNKTPEEFAREAYNNEALMAAYLKEQGKEIPIKTREVLASGANLKPEYFDTYKKIQELLQENKLTFKFIDDVNSMSGRNLIEKYAAIAAPANERIQTLLNIWNEKKLDIAGKSLMRWLKDTYEYMVGGTETRPETDWYETKKAMREEIDENDFTNWLAEKIRPAYGQTGIRNNLDTYTKMGNRRSFKQLHSPYSIENVVKAMYTNATEKGQNGRYATGAIATASKEYRTLEEVRADENRLELRDQEEYDEIIENLNQRMNQMAEEFGESKYTFDYAVIEAGRNYAKRQTLDAIKRGFADENVTITTEQAKKVKALLDDMREIPTGYFEAKPMRVMGFDEIGEVILPERYDRLTAELDKFGIPYETTDGTEEARKEALNNYTSEQFSIKDRDPGIDIDQWMLSVPESSLQTDAEKMLLRSYKDLNKAIEVNDENIRNLRKRISFLQEKKNKTREENNMLSALRIRLENAESARKVNVAKMKAVQRTDGYANIMRQQQDMMQRFVSGKTQDEVIRAVSGMEDAAKALQADIAKTAKELDALANDEGVKRIKSRIGSASMEKVAARIRKNYNSNINKQELMNDLSRIRLMIENGESAEDIEAEIENMAGRIVEGRKSSEKNYSLEALRGVTLRLSDSAMKEIYGSNSNIKEIRRMLAGSGVKVARAAEGKGSLDANWSELVSFVPALDHYNGYDTENALDQMKAVAEFVQNSMAEQKESGKNELAGMMDDVILDLTGEIASIDMNMPADPKARKQVQGLIDYIVDMSERANASAAKVAELEKKLNAMVAGGRQAANWSRDMKADIAQTIDYFKLTSKMALDQAKANKQSEIIRQLKDENVQKIIKNNEEWRALIQRDADARRQADKNAMARRKMSTVMNRINKLLSSETDQQNIPENFKGLARELLGMFVDNDMGEGGRKLTSANRKTLENTKRLLDIWEKQDGPFNLADLTTERGQDPEGITLRVMDDIETIREAMEEWNRKYNGKNKLDTLQQMGKTLERMQEAVSEIYNIIQSARTMDINGRKYQIEEMGLKFLDGTKKSRFKGEATKAAGKAVDKIRNLAITGNTTPEYFFKNLRNAGMTEIWNEFKRGENKNGLEIAKAQKRIGEIAEKHGYKDWNMKQRHTVETLNGNVEMTTEQLMALWATWKREQTMGPEQSQHLTRGGFYVAEDRTGKGITGRVKENARPHVMDEQLMAKVGEQLTDAQKAYIDDMVAYMSSELSELGNEASMRMYGIKKYKEKYYYPFKRWTGVGNFSSDKGSQATDDNRAAHKGWTKRRMNMASNALEIGDFTKTVVNHAVEMINYNTMAPAIEAMNKVLNWQNTEYPGDGTTIKRNMRAVFGQEYGKESLRYLETLLQDMNGGVVQDPRGSTLDKLLSVFKKGAVSGSLSVAAQQPLSFIRAAMEINPIYLVKGLNPATFKNSYKEMMAHSGVAVIKAMGRFDMGYGASAKEYVAPEAAMSRGEKIREKITDIATGLPEIMDRATWTRMWEAVKAEQKARHPGMDYKSDEFLDMVGERFNEVMRRTQVYDSVLVKSSNMRSKHFGWKSLTAFMAEPTVSLNVLRDAAINIGEKGGVKKAAMAGATFLLSAIAQAAAKGLFGAGRNPDDKKTKEENFLYRMMYNLVSEVNPMNLIPGFSDLVEVLTKGELTDNSMTPIGKLYDIYQTIQKTDDKTNAYRLVEDTAGQIAQLFTGVPLKNVMRDVRAMINWYAPNSGLNELVGGKPYATRENSPAVIKYQTIDTIMNKDIVGMVNTWLGDAGYKMNNAAYYQRILDAEKAGNTGRAEELTEYLIKGKGTTEKVINQGINSLAKKDDSLTNMEKAEIIAEHGGNTNSLIKDAAEAGEISTAEAVSQLDYKNPSSYITGQLKDGKIDAAEAQKLLKEQNPEKSDESIWWTVDRIEYQKETGAEEPVSGTYYRLWDAMDANKADEIGKAISTMTAHGVQPKSIKSQITSQYKDAYIQADGAGKRKIRDAVQKAYRKLGYTAEDADKVINKWK